MLSPIEKILEKRKAEKELSTQIYEKIFDLGVNKTAEIFCIKPEETIKLIIKIARKNGEIDKLKNLCAQKKLNKIEEEIINLQSFSTEKIYKNCEKFAEIWEIEVAKSILKQKLKQELTENE